LTREEDERQEAIRVEAERLRNETRLWRGINSAQWVMWGIVQAKVPGMPDFDDGTPRADGAVDADATPKGPGQGKEKEKEKEPAAAASDGSVSGVPVVQTPDAIEESGKGLGEAPQKENGSGEGEEDEEGFDYLSYAFERALFFWGDVISLGIMSKDELPEEVVKNARIVDY
jgi:choline kinase